MERMKWVAKISGGSGLAAAAAAFILFEFNPSWRIAITLLLILSAGLLVLFFRLRFESLKSFSTRRSTKLGFNSVLMVAIILSILIILNFISSRHPFRMDFSETERFTLAPQTLLVLKNLERDVRIMAFVSEQGRTRPQIEDLMNNYRYHTSHISFTLIDPDKKPAIAKQYGITQYDTLVLESGQQETQVKSATEQELTNAIIRVSKDERRKILFLEDHGEHSPADPEKAGYSQVREALQKQGFEIESLSLLEQGTVPEGTSVLVIAGPQKGILPQEKSALSEYLSKGGKVLLLLDPDVPARMDDFLSEWGVKMGQGVIIDTLSRLLGGDFTIPVVTQYPPHEITQEFHLATFFPVSQGIEFDNGRAAEIEFMPLANSGDNSWMKRNLRSGQLNFNPAEDIRGPLTIAAVLTRRARASDAQAHDPESDSGIPGTVPDETGRDPSRPTLVLFGDSDFAANASFNFSGNGDLLLNTINWLAQEKGLISIRPKEPSFTPLFLTSSQGKILMYVSLILLPGATVIAGIFIRRRRRHL